MLAVWSAWSGLQVQAWAPPPTQYGGAAPGPSPDPVDLEFDRLAERYGVTPEQFQDWGLKGWYLFTLVLAVAVAVLVLRAIYRGMQRPRLTLTHRQDLPPTASRRAIVRYLATPVFWIPLWFVTVLSVLVLAANRGDTIRPANELIIAAAVVVGGARLLAHINLEGAHELAKSVPLTLLSLILISGQTISVGAGIVAVVLLLYNLGSLLYYVILLAAWDLLFTFGWLLSQRLSWRRAQRASAAVVGGSWRHDVWESLSRGWGSSEAGPSEAQTVVATPRLSYDDGPTATRARQMMLLPDPPEAQRQNVLTAAAPTPPTRSGVESP